MTEDQQLELVERLAEEFTARLRRGEKPTIKEYTDRHVELAVIIRDTFQALAIMEDLAPEDGESLGEPPSTKPTLGAARLDYLGDYRIIREVGRGGMGIVYEAEQVSLGRHVAVKVLPKELLENPKHRARFEREAKAAAKLHHTNIVPVFGVGEENGMGYYVMQFIQGLALDEVLDELKRMKLRSGSAGIIAEFSRSWPRRRDVSAADVARSLIDGSFQSLADKTPSGSGKRRMLDETMAHEPLHASAERQQRGSPPAGAAVTESQQVKSPGESTASARVSDTLSVPSASDVLSGSSSERHKRDRKLTYWQSVANIGVQVAEALHYAHGQGILHRDIKPSNLLLDLRGTVWVTDFGLAKLDDDRGLTQTGDILGTLRYLAPETFRQQADARSEVYSLGLTLYELLALRPAFEPTNRHALIDQVLSGQIEPLVKRNHEIPRDLATIVHKAVERDARHRYQTAQDLADDLRRFIDDEPIQARQLSTFEHAVRWSRHNRGLAASLAAVAALVCVVAIGSTIAAGYFQSVSGTLSNTVVSLEATQRELHVKVEALNDATGEAQKKATENLRLANAAQQNLLKAEAAEEEGRLLLYTTDMRLAPFIWKDERSTGEQLRALLARHEPSGRQVGWDKLALASAGPPVNRADGGPARPESRLSHPTDQSQQPHEPEDLRGFEWYYYKHLLEDSARVFRGHAVPVVGGALTTGGQLLTVDENSQVRRWDLQSRAEDQVGRVDLAQGRNVQATALARNGRLAAVAADDKIYLLDAVTGEDLVSFDSAASAARSLAFSNDGGLLVILDDKIHWCDTKYGRVVATIDERFDRVEDLALSADGLTVSVAGHGTLGTLLSISRLDVGPKKVSQAAKDVRLSHTINTAAVSPDGTLVAVGLKFGGGLSVFDATTGALVASKSLAHASPVTALAFSADSSQLVTGDEQGTIKIWEDVRKLDAKIGPKQTLKGHAGKITSVSFSSDGTQVFSTGRDHTARIWDTQQATAPIRPLFSCRGICFTARYSPDGQFVAAAEGSQLRLWDAATGEVVRELSPGDGSKLASVAFSPDGRMLAVGHGGSLDQSYISLWDIDSGKQLARLPGITDLDDVPRQGDFGSVTAVAFSPDGRYLVAGFGSLTVFTRQRFTCPLKVWEVHTRRLVRRLQGHLGLCTSLCFSPNGALCASGNQDGTAIIWSSTTWKRVRTLENPDPESSANLRIVADVAFSPDGKTLAMASREGSVVLWDMATGDRVATLKGHSSSVTAVAFSPDGRTLASAGSDETVWLWNVAARQQLVELDLATAELGSVRSLAFSPDGWRLLAAGAQRTAFWSSEPPDWDNSDAWSAQLASLLKSSSDFRGRIRILSEKPWLRETLAKMPSDDPRVRTALAATRANWHAAHRRWCEAAKEFDRLKELSPNGLDGWLRIPGLVRLAHALVESGRPVDAAALLVGGAKRRIEDGAQVGAGHVDESLNALRSAVDERLAADAQNSGLLELRAQIAGQRSDRNAQLADYAAAIESLAGREPEASADLKRLHRRRGDVYLALKHWRQAADDYACGLSDDASGEELSNQALAQAGVLLDNEIQTLVPTSENDGVQWRFTTRQPSEDWGQTEFDDSAWEEGLAPFGLDYAGVRTTWSAPDLWLRRRFEGPANDAAKTLSLRVNVDDTAEVFLNGQRLAARDTWTVQQYVLQSVDDVSPNAVRPGTNVLAVHCRNSVRPAGFIDIGLFAARTTTPAWARFSAAKATNDAWTRLATAYRLVGDEKAINLVVERWPQSAAPIGDLFAAENDWRRAVDLYSKGLTVPADPELLARRARAYEHLGEWDAAAADWIGVANDNPQAADLLAEFARRLWQNDRSQLAGRYIERSQQLYEEQLRADLENDVVAESLAELLLGSQIQNGRWTVLKPTELRSKLGATFVAQADGSLLTDSTKQSGELYTVTCSCDMPRVAALRIEALPHAALRNKGPGWGLNGNFHVSKLRVVLRSPGKPDLVLAFRKRLTDDATSAAETVNDSTSWDLWPGDGRPHWLVLIPGEPVEVGTDDQIALELEFSNPNRPAAKLGCFRISVTSDTDNVERNAQVAAALQVRDPWMRLAAAYARQGQLDKATTLAGRALDGAKSVHAEADLFESIGQQEDLLVALAEQRQKDPQAQLAWAKHLAHRGKLRLAEKHASEAERDLADAQSIFARLRSELPEPSWTVLKPTKMISQGGATLTRLGDGSVLAGGTNPAKEVYEIEAQLNSGPATAVRLEGLRHESLPRGGAARSNDADVVLSELEVAVAGSGPEDWQSVNFERAWTNNERPGMSVDRAIDGHESTGWGTIGQLSSGTCTAIFVAAAPFGDAGGTTLRIRLRHESASSKNQFGRFRLSVADASHILQATALNQANREVRDAMLDLGRVYAQENRPDDAARAFVQAVSMASGRDAKSKIVNVAADEGMLDKLSAAAENDAPLQAEIGRYYAEQGHRQLARAARKTAQDIYERRLEKFTPTSQRAREIAAELAELLLADAEASLILRACPWVWFPGDGPVPPTSPRYFRGAIEVDPNRELVDARLRLTADNNFALHLNGQELGHGNSAEDGWKDPQTIPLTAHLKAGRNAVAIEAVNFTSANSGDVNPAGLIGRYEITYSHGVPVMGMIDETWKSSDIAADGWRQTEFDDSQWPNAKKIADYGGGAWSAFERDSKMVKPSSDPWPTLAAAYRVSGNSQASYKVIDQHPRSCLPAADFLADNGRWPLAIELYSKAIAQQPTDELRIKRAHAYEQVHDWKAAAADWQCATEKHRRGAELLAEFAQRLEDNGQSSLAADHFDRSKRLYEEALQTDPLNVAAAEALATLLLDSQKAVDGWTVLNPLEVESERGVTLSIQVDGSVLASGEELFADTYTLTAASSISKAVALRLEALPHPSLPAAGPGWQGGNFHLTELRAHVQKPSQAAVPVTFSLAAADYTRPSDGDAGPDDGPPATIDGNQETRWDVWPRVGRPHWLIALLDKPIDLASDDQLVVELDFRDSRWPRARLGCFRLSVTGDESCHLKDMLRQAVIGGAVYGMPSLAAARLALGDADQAASLLSASHPADNPLQHLLLLALAEHQLGHAAAAREACNSFLEALKTRPLVRELEPLAVKMVALDGPLSRDQLRRLLDQSSGR
jgi:eukaryotic-like serine/threonine-protein kinase